jgi:hypothetical protein
MVSKKQVIWTFGMGAAGLFLGLKGQDTREDMFGTALIVIWFASIGFGLGGVFGLKAPSRWIVVHWAIALASVFPFVALATAAILMPAWPNLSFVKQASVGIVGACVGALLGICAGKLHLRRLQANSAAS